MNLFWSRAQKAIQEFDVFLQSKTANGSGNVIPENVQKAFEEIEREYLASMTYGFKEVGQQKAR